MDTFKISNLHDVRAREQDSQTGTIWFRNSESLDELIRDSGVITVSELAHLSKSETKSTKAMYVNFRGCPSSNMRGFSDFPNFKGNACGTKSISIRNRFAVPYFDMNVSFRRSSIV